MAHPLRRFVLLAALALPWAFAVDPLGTSPTAAPGLRLVATVGMVGDLAGWVGGGCVQVETLMGPGIDPHLYRASASDVRRLSEAEAIVMVGGGLEGQLAAVLQRFASRTPTLGYLSDALSAQAPLRPGDPHAWGDALLWGGGLEALAAFLSALRPACAATFTARADLLAAHLSALDGWARESIATIPAPRTLVTAHDAFAYFGAAYDLAVAGIEGISTESEASIADIRAIADLIAEAGVAAIFVETTIAPRTVEAVQAAVRARGHEVAIGGGLYADALGDRGTFEGTYVGAFAHNVRTVVAALGGSPAPWPEVLIPWLTATAAW
jgi:manganese/zinc/iron transport system substrate-binding protein